MATPVDTLQRTRLPRTSAACWGWRADALPIAEDGTLPLSSCQYSAGRDLPATDEVHVWFADLAEVSADQEAFWALLDREERARANRYVFVQDRTRFVLCRGLARLLLAPYAGCPPEGVAFAVGVHGKPTVANAPGLSFSLSHSATGVALAVARGFDVGIDIEAARGIGNMEGIVARHFCAAEVSAFNATDPAARRDAFQHLWTRKEAFVKGIGRGLSYPLDGFCVSLGVPATIAGEGTESWTLRAIDPGPGFVGALAAQCRRPLLSGARLQFSDTIG